MSTELVITFIAFGAFVGIAAGFLGIGGGGILVPVFTTIFIYQGIPKDTVVHLALGTSMACIALISYSSMRAHHANWTVIWPLVKIMFVGMIVGTFSATVSNFSSQFRSISDIFCYLYGICFARQKLM